MIMKDGSVVQIGTPEEILTQPENDYVERFVEDVDRSKVFTAENVMIRPETINLEKTDRVLPCNGCAMRKFLAFM